MSQPHVFLFGDIWWFYAIYIAGIVGLLVLDLVVFHRKAHVVSMKEAGLWTIFWVSLALAFNAALYFFLPGVIEDYPRAAEVVPGMTPRELATDLSLKFLVGYLVELSLSVDNLFVFVVIFSYFAIPATVQHRILFFGILGAIVFRALFIGISSILMQFEAVVLLMGVFLIYTGIRLCIPHDEKIEPEKNPLIRLFRRFVPVTHAFHADHFFIREAGRWVATPLFIALLVVEMTDIVFAIDSVPAIFGITKETVIVFTSNMFAVLGLRSLYFLLAGAVTKFYMLKYGLGVILAFVGLKMSLLHYLHIQVPIPVSLGVVLGLLVASIALSLMFPRKERATAPPPPRDAAD